MMPQISVMPSRPFAVNTSGAFQPDFVSSADVAALEFGDDTAVAQRPQFATGGISTRE